MNYSNIFLKRQFNLLYEMEFYLQKHFFLHHCFQNGSGAHPASYPVDNRGSLPGDKAAEE
jgi:hypothetical protein